MCRTGGWGVGGGAASLKIGNHWQFSITTPAFGDLPYSLWVQTLSSKISTEKLEREVTIPFF